MSQKSIGFSRKTLLAWVMAALLCALAAPENAWADEVPGLNGSVDASPFSSDGAGYAQVKVTIANSGEQSRVVVMVAEASNNPFGRRFVKRVLVSPNSTVRATMPVPRWFGQGSMVRLRCEGVEFASTGLRGSSQNQAEVVRMTTDAKAALEPMIRFQSWNESRGGYSYYGGSTPRASYEQVTAAVGSWPTEGAEYFGIPALVMTEAQWKDAPEGVRKALVDYVAFGGLLGVVGDVPAPAAFKEVRPDAWRSESMTMTPVPPQATYSGSGTSGTPSPIPMGGLVTRRLQETNRAYAYGYGLFYVLPLVDAAPRKDDEAAKPVGGGEVKTSARPTPPSKSVRSGSGDMLPARQAAHWREFIRDCEALASSDMIASQYNRYGYYGSMGNSKWRDAFKVAHTEGLSRNLMFAMLLCFSVAVVSGIVMLRMRGKKMWILVAMPSLSVACALGLVVLTMLSEGFGGVSNVAAVTFLDQRTQEGRTLGVVGIYSPLGLGASGLRFDSETQILNPPGEMGQEGCMVDMTQDEHVEDGWLTPRVVGYLQLAKRSARKERLLFAKDGDGYSVTNGLGAPITRLQYRDAAGRRFSAGPMAAGATAAMTEEQVVEEAVLRGETGEQWRGREASNATSTWLRSYWMQSLRVVGPASLFWPAPGEYVCELSGSPFLEDGMKGSGTTTGRNVVLGVVEK